MEHAVVSREEWLEARKALLAKEKALTRQRDAVSRERQALPWVEVGKEYVLESPDGPVTLSELFDGRSQLLVYHFMFGPGWKEGCPGCSFLSDHVDGARQHFEHHDVSYVAVSRAPIDQIQHFQQRMGWGFRWVSSFESDFNFDYRVSFTPEQIAAGEAEYNFQMSPVHGEEAPGLSAFYKNESGRIFHTYSTYARGGEALLGTYGFLDFAPLGRNETGDMGNWMRHHDRYEDTRPAAKFTSGDDSSVTSASIKSAVKTEACCESETR